MNKYTIENIVRWRDNPETQLEDCFGLLDVQQTDIHKKYDDETIKMMNEVKDSCDDSRNIRKLKATIDVDKNLIEILFEHLIDIDSDIIKYFDNKIKYEETQFRYPFDNVKSPQNYKIENITPQKLLLSAHPDVVKWVENNKSADIEIIKIPQDSKIVILDTFQGHGPEDLYEYIVVKKTTPVFHC